MATTSNKNFDTETRYSTKDVLIYVPTEQLTIAFPIDGNKGMYPKGMFNVNKCVQALTKKLKIQTKIPMIKFLDENILYKKGVGQNFIYCRTDGKIVMTYDAMIVLSYVSQYNFQPQYLDETNSITDHINMIDWQKNSNMKDADKDADNDIVKETTKKANKNTAKNTSRNTSQDEGVKNSYQDEEKDLANEPTEIETQLESKTESKPKTKTTTAKKQSQSKKTVVVEDGDEQPVVASKTKKNAAQTAAKKRENKQTRSKKSSTIEDDIKRPIATSENIRNDQQLALQTIPQITQQSDKQSDKQSNKEDNDETCCNEELLDQLADTLNSIPQNIEFDMDTTSFSPI